MKKPTSLEMETLDLLVRWITAAETRRVLEKACGYPPEYGDDQEVLCDTVALFQRLKKELEL
jgi:hypothetical protein